MDLSFTADELAFAAEVAGPGWPPTWSRRRTFAVAWRRRSPGGGRGRPAWPRTAGSASVAPPAYGGRDATPVQVALFNMEYARAGAPQPVNRVGINLAGPTLLAHGTDAAAGPVAAERSSTPPRSGASCSASPTPGRDLASLTTRATPRGPRRPRGWSLTGQKVWTSLRPVRPVGDLPGPHRPRRPQAPRHLLPGGGHGRAPGIEIRPLVQMTGEAEFNEVFLDEVFVPGGPPGRRPAPGLGRGQHDAGPRAGHATSRSRSRSCTRCTWTELYDLALEQGTPRRPRGGRRPGAGVRATCACCGCTTGARSPGSAGASSPARSPAW